MPVVAEIVGWEFLLVIALVALLFGSSQIPKFARSIGEASKELKKGMAEGAAEEPAASATPTTADEPASKGDTKEE
jgi:sec-independent protein translocase protein TatA